MKSAPRSRHWQPMLAIVVLLASATALVACSPSSTVGAPVPENVIPEGLKDCGFFKIVTGNGIAIHIVRCPNSTTSAATNGKSPVYSSISDNGPATPNIPLDARAEHDRGVDAILKKIDDEIARLEAKKKELK